MKATILIVDDDQAHLSMLTTILSGWGYATEGAEDGSEAIELVREKPYDAILMDVRMTNIGGIEALEKIKELNPAIPIIIMTAYSSVDTAVEAMKLGAYDYLTKPLNFDDLKITMGRALEHMALVEENKNLKDRITAEANLDNIIGNSQSMVKLIEMVKTVAPTEATILITGESGTGKELIARAIHANSQRKDGPLITVNCAAITDTLLESELFGHEKGAFTGADKKRDGKFLQAHKGSIFLDEVGEIPLHMQAKLLRAIQEREIQRVGSDKPIHVDVRIIAATNRKLLEDVEAGRFREDLFYRLNVVNLKLPALNERKEDIPLLAKHFLKKFAKANRKNTKGFTPTAMDMILRHNWQGNVRELENVMERAIILSLGDYITERELPPALVVGKEKNSDQYPPSRGLAGMPLEDVEKTAIIQTLHETKGNKSEAAKILQITRTTLNNKIKKYDIQIN